MICIHRSKRENGFTLVEVLVTLAIASVITLIALPVARDAIRQHSSTRSAEVVRQVFVNARAQAIRSDRPFGVMLKRIGTTGVAADVCRSLSFVSTPPMYRGDVVGATVTKISNGAPVNRFRFGFTQLECGRLWFESQSYAAGNAAVQRRLSLRPGAILYIGDNIGPFHVTGVSSTTFNRNGSTVTGVVVDAVYNIAGTPGDMPILPNDTQYSFEMQGVPQESFLPGAELPRDSAIDLSISGMGLNRLQFNSEVIRADNSADGDTPGSLSGFDRVVVLFGSRGNVQRVYFETWNPGSSRYDVLPQLPSGTIYLAIGRADGVLRPEEYVAFDTTESWRGTLPNFASTETVWLSVRSSSGSVDASPQVGPIEGAANFYTATGTSAPSTGTTVSDRIEQRNMLRFRVTQGRQLAKQGELIQ